MIPARLALASLLMLAVLSASCKAKQPGKQRGGTEPQPSAGPPIAPGPLGPLGPTGVSASQSTKLENIGPLPLSEFVYPLPGGQFGSKWCVCRSIGTSPHIGQDMTTPSGDQISVAVGKGQVSKIGFDSACGYAVHLTDVNGAEWIYRHCDKPFVSEGQSLSTGQRICQHERWPTSGCGTGPHLHFERRSPSVVIPGDKEQGKACHYGYRTCYFDPTVIASSRHVSPTSSYALAGSVESPPSSEGSLEQLEESLVATQSASVSCLAPQTLSGPPPGLGSAADIDRISIQVETMPSSGGTLRIQTLRLSVLGNPNAENLCEDALRHPACIRSFQLFGQSSENVWTQIAEMTGMDNLPLVFNEDAGICLPEGPGRIWAIAKTPSGEALVGKASLP